MSKVSEVVCVRPPRAAGAAPPRVTSPVLPPSDRQGRFLTQRIQAGPCSRWRSGASLTGQALSSPTDTSQLPLLWACALRTKLLFQSPFDPSEGPILSACPSPGGTRLRLGPLEENCSVPAGPLPPRGSSPTRLRCQLRSPVVGDFRHTSSS